MGPTGRSLRILYHHRVAAADGMRVHINEIVENLRAAGHEVRVVGPEGAAGAVAGQASRTERLAEMARRALPAALYEALELAYNLPAYVRLASAARAFRPDVIYERYNLFLLAGLMLARRRRLPLLLEVNAPLLDERSANGGLQLKTFGRMCEAILWRGADIVLPVSEVLAGAVRGVRGRPAGVHVTHNGGDPSQRPDPATVAAVRRDLGFGPEDVVLGFVGFVRPWHGLTAAVDALAGLPPNVRLVVVGDGPGCADLEARAAALGLGGRVRLVGRVPHREVAAYMAGFDVALQTAATAYCSPLKLFEYMALGCAVIAPDQPNIREVLTPGRDALLFPPGDHEAMCAALAQLATDGALRSRLGTAASETLIARRHTWRHNAERIAALAAGELAPSRLAATAGQAAPSPQPS
jgi:glycosyltransferase involved in cell wall biosynthesis